MANKFTATMLLSLFLVYFSFLSFPNSCTSAATVAGINAQEKDSKLSKAIYYNPVLDYSAPDPYVTLVNGYYYLILSINGELIIYKSRQLTNFRNAQTKSIYRLPQGMGQLWAPEIHFLHGNWTVYFAMGYENNVPSNRMWAIQSFTDDPFGEWMTNAVR